MIEAAQEGTATASFWTFSCTLYARPSIATTCLYLQDDFGADMNVLLFGLYVAQTRRELSSQDFEHLDRQCRQWRDTIVRPLRAVRRASKDASSLSGDGELRQKVAQAELEAERHQQLALEKVGAALGRMAEAGASLRDIAVGNLEAYAATCPAGRFTSDIVAGLADSLVATGA